MSQNGTPELSKRLKFPLNIRTDKYFLRHLQINSKQFESNSPLAETKLLVIANRSNVIVPLRKGGKEEEKNLVMNSLEKFAQTPQQLQHEETRTISKELRNAIKVNN